MPHIPSVTYQEIVNKVKSKITSSCSNIASFSSISNVFKTGYSQTISISGGNSTASCSCKVAISGNNITEVASSTVDTDMTAFIQTIGLTDKLNTNIKETECIKFINDMVSFCSTKLAYSISQYAQSTRYLIYNTSSSTYQSTETILTGGDIKQIDLSDASTIVNMIVNIAKQNIKCRPCRYSITYS